MIPSLILIASVTVYSALCAALGMAAERHLSKRHYAPRTGGRS